MKRGALTLCAFALAASVAACGDDSAESAPSATVGTAPKTTTTLSVEAEVEAAYLRSWDVYAEAVRTFDTTALDEVYDGSALRLVEDEVRRLREANTPIVVQVEHDLSIQLADSMTAFVRDTYVNRNYRIDGESGDPIDATDDPGTYVELYELRREAGRWRVVVIVRESYSQ